LQTPHAYYSPIRLAAKTGVYGEVIQALRYYVPQTKLDPVVALLKIARSTALRLHPIVLFISTLSNQSRHGKSAFVQYPLVSLSDSDSIARLRELCIFLFITVSFVSS
jgi:hypothetical protein